MDDSLWGASRKEVMRWIVVVGGAPGRCSLGHLPQQGPAVAGPCFFLLALPSLTEPRTLVEPVSGL